MVREFDNQDVAELFYGLALSWPLPWSTLERQLQFEMSTSKICRVELQICFLCPHTHKKNIAGKIVNRTLTDVISQGPTTKCVDDPLRLFFIANEKNYGRRIFPEQWT